MTTSLPINHAARRERDFKIRATAMIGRLTAAEFDVLDAIVANMRIGITTTYVPLARTLGIDAESVTRRMYEYGKLGLVTSQVVEQIAIPGQKGNFVDVRAFTPSERGWVLFKEALAMMDRGEVAA